MYHCRVEFYLAGEENRLFDLIKQMPAFERFTHKFYESKSFERNFAAKSDVIFIRLDKMNEQEISSLISHAVSEKKKDSQLIVLSEKEHIPLLCGDTDGITDIWTLPMSDEELRFRFYKWQQKFKAEMDSKETKHFFETTINNIPNLIWYKDKNGIHEKVNDSFCRAVNKTKENVEGKEHAYIWDVESDDPACIESERKVMDTRKTCVSEETVQTGEGTMLLTTYKSPLYDFDGSVMGTVGVAIDITKERAYENELTQKNRSLEKIFTSIDCGIICHSLDGSRLLSVNNAALRILGYDSISELKNDGFDMIAHTVIVEDRAMLTEKIKRLNKPGDMISVEYRVRHKDGNLLHIMGNIKLLEENGEMFYQRFLLDCTAQKLLENENKKHQSELIHALSNEYSLVFFLDLGTRTGNALRITGCEHNVLENIFGQSDKIIMEKHMAEYIKSCVYEDDKEMMTSVCSCIWLKKELADKKSFHVNYRTLCGKEIRYFQMKGVRVGTWEKVCGVVIGFRCIDEEIKSEIEQKNLLESALAQANRANKAKSLFLSNMSHDIRTPMNAIVGFTSLALGHIDHKEQVEGYLKKIMSSGNHLLSLINDVLDMSRIESGKIHIEEKPCSLAEILRGLHNIIQADIRAKQIDFVVDTVDVYDEEIFCDKLRLNQVLLNLLSNAVKYTGSGGTITMRIFEKKSSANGYANYEFLIKDTGMGMSKEFVSHIFEPFERERNSTISGIQGTGLGMAITKNIVDLMDGKIDVKSEKNVGTECRVSFTFKLNPDAKKYGIIPEFRNYRALVVDDDFNTCDSVSYMLQNMGMRAEWTLSGKEAILRTRQALMREDTYSVYIVDWLLPDLNGIEVVRRIRKETGDNAPVIVLTAYDWSDIEDEAKEAGVSAFCSKPLFMSELRSCLDSIVNKNASEQVAEEGPPIHHSERILLAEDNPLNQEIAVEILSEAGFWIEVAENGRIAVDMLQKSEPGYYQVILMDVQMPEMNGYEAAKAIRKLENKELASIPILAMTANAFEEDKQEALESGMNAHVAKPIDVKKLIETLDTVLKYK